MKLLDRLLGKKKTQDMAQTASMKPLKHPATRKLNSGAQIKSLPQKQPDICQSALRPLNPNTVEQGVFQCQTCKDNNHDFVRPYPFKCRKCGMALSLDSDHLRRYMGSYYDGTAYQWTQAMNQKRIVSFFLSTGNRPVFSASCNFSSLTVRSSLHGSRDGWMQNQYPSDYFTPREITLNSSAVRQLRAFLETCDFSTWSTPVHYVENHDAPGFSVEKSFRCTFADGKQFACLDPDNQAFEQLVSLLREIVVSNAAPEDLPFINRMMENTAKKAKHIYWLISCADSMAGKWMDILAQGVPFFNYGVARDMHRGQNANADLLINVIRFANGASWVTDAPVPEAEYHWEPLSTDSRNDVGAAFTLLAERFQTLPEPERQLFPIVVLVLDGSPTDDYRSALKYFENLPGVERNVLTVVFALGNHVDKKLLKIFGKGCVFHINSLDDFLYEIDPMLFSF